MKKLLLSVLLASMPMFSFAAPAVVVAKPTPAAVTPVAPVAAKAFLDEKKHDKIGELVAVLLKNLNNATSTRAERFEQLKKTVLDMQIALEKVVIQDLTAETKQQIIDAYDALYAEANELFNLYKDSFFADFFSRYHNSACKELVKIQQVISNEKEKVTGYSIWNNLVKKSVKNAASMAWNNKTATIALALFALKFGPYAATFTYHHTQPALNVAKWLITPGGKYNPAPAQ
jgi:hypothetical protein